VSRFSAYIRHNVLGFVAIFIALTMGTAYATHPGGEGTISTEDIQNRAVTQPKIGPQAVSVGKLQADAVSTPKIQDQAVTTPKIGPRAVRTGKIFNGAVNSAKVADNSLTGADIDETSLGKVPNAANVDTVTTERVSLVEGDVSDPILFQRGDWRITANCLDDPNSAFPLGQLTLRYLSADPDIRASAVLLGGTPLTMTANTLFNLVSSTALIHGATFFASDDLSRGIQGLASVRIPSRDGAYSGDPGCQFEVVVLG
jgi:hypothetical protein